MRHRYGFDPMTNAVDIQPDLVTGGDICEGCHLDVGGSRWRFHRQIRLCASLADRGHRRDLILFLGICNDRIGRAIAKRNFLSNNKAGCILNGHISRAGRNCDHQLLRQGLPHSCVVAGSRTEACDLARFHTDTSADVDRVADRHSLGVSDMDDAVTCACGDRQP